MSKKFFFFYYNLIFFLKNVFNSTVLKQLDVLLTVFLSHPVLFFVTTNVAEDALRGQND